MMLKQACVDYQGLERARIDPYGNAISVLSLRAVQENPPLLRDRLSRMSKNPNLLLYVSLSEQYADWWAHPAGTFAHDFGKIVSENRWWVDDREGRGAGLNPKYGVWPGGAFMDLSFRDCAEEWADKVAEAVIDLDLSEEYPVGVLVDHVYGGVRVLGPKPIERGGGHWYSNSVYALAGLRSQLRAPVWINQWNTDVVSPGPWIDGRMFEDVNNLPLRSIMVNLLQPTILHASIEHTTIEDRNALRALALITGTYLEWSQKGGHHDGTSDSMAGAWPEELRDVEHMTPAASYTWNRDEKRVSRAFAKSAGTQKVLAVVELESGKLSWEIV